VGAKGFPSYEGFLSGGSEAYAWPEFDENTACGLYYTSVTTGNPKGVLYSHRSAVLHSCAAALPDACRISLDDTVALVSPMFHAMFWGMPYCATRRQGLRLKAQDLLAFCEGKIAKGWMPDDVLFVDELPHGATGKVLKTKLRELYGNRDLAAISRTKTP